MKKNIIFVLIVVMVIGVFYTAFKNKKTVDTTQTALTKVRIGWQTPWATQGQLIQSLKHTEILKDHNLEGEFNGFAYGAPLNEAALAGNVDVVLTADQPAATLLAKNTDWKIIGRLMYNRVSFYVPSNSPIKEASQLKGKTVGMPFGAAAQRMALRVEKEAGLDPKTDVNNINLGMSEQAELIKKNPTAEKWGEVDALAGFDPSPAVFEEKGWVNTIAEETVTSVIMMSTKYIEANPEAPVNFLAAFTDAYDYYRNNISEVNAWFTDEAQLSITETALAKAASVEPNLQVTNKIRISFTEADMKVLQDAADFIYDQGLVKTDVVMKDYVDQSYLQQIDK